MSILRSFSNRVDGGVILGQRPKPSLRFGGLMWKKAKSLSNYGIHDRSIQQFRKSILCANECERPNVISKQDGPGEQDQPFLIIWRRDYDKILLGLFIEHIQNGERNMLYYGKDSWCGIVHEFNKSTGLKCDYEYLCKRFKSYKSEYEIVNSIMHHQKFGWDHQHQILIATEDDWNEHIERYPGAKFYKKIMPYFDLLEEVFGDKQEQEIP